MSDEQRSFVMYPCGCHATHERDRDGIMRAIYERECLEHATRRMGFAAGKLADGLKEMQDRVKDLETRVEELEGSSDGGGGATE